MTEPASSPGPHPRNGSTGSVAIHLAAMLLAIMGFAALGTEVAFLLRMHRAMQSASDAGALSAATAIATGYPASPPLEALATASTAGFTDGVDDTTVTVNIPPLSGLNIGNPKAVEVIVDQPQTLAILSLFGPATLDVGARAVAIAGSEGLYCILSLDPTASGAITLSNNAAVINPNCGLGANSSSGSALVLNSNATVAGPVAVHGGWSLANNASLTNTKKVSSAPIIPDPYASVATPTAPGCTGQSGTGTSATISLTPGHFCSGWNFTNNVTLKLAPGTYYIDQKLALANNVAVNGTGVTLVINGNYAMSLGNNVELDLTAPATGTLAGLAFVGSRTATPSLVQRFSNNTTLNVKGAIYFPNQAVRFDNNATITPAPCTQLIARTITLSNNAYFGNQCTGTGTQPIGPTPTQLVE